MTQRHTAVRLMKRHAKPRADCEICQSGLKAAVKRCKGAFVLFDVSPPPPLYMVELKTWTLRSSWSPTHFCSET